MDSTRQLHLCFPNLNSSCKRPLRPPTETALLYTVLISISFLTVTLNSLVIFSISHFRQLHTPTNTLLQSLAASDLLLGLLVMPIVGLRYIETCWLMGRFMCALSPFLFYCLTSVSLGHMVLLSIVRYVTVSDPLLNSYKITMTNVRICICLCWVFSVIYNVLILMEHMRQPDRFSSCDGECVVIFDHITGIIDLFFNFAGPFTVMVVLYMRVFQVALSQARVIQSQVAAANPKATPASKTSQKKAGRTIGILILVYLLCYCPYYYPTLVGEDRFTTLSYYSLLTWILLMHSFLNPLMYTLLFPWLRKCIKLIFTLRILHSNSHEVIIM